MERDYYIIERDGESFSKIKQFIASHHKANAARAELMKRYGGSAMYGNDHALLGFVFDGENVPDGFRPSKDEKNVYVPHKVTKAGRDLAKELSKPELTLPNGMDFHWLFDDDIWMGEHVPGRGFRMPYILYEKFGDDFILTVPVKGRPKDWQPPTDCRLMKKSEYWLIKEAKEEAKATNP